MAGALPLAFRAIFEQGRQRMFSPLILVLLAIVVTATSFISGIFGMAGGMLLIGFLLFVLPVQIAMVMHGVTQIAANSWRAFLWRQHVKWSVVLRFGAGCATSLVTFSFFSFVPDKSMVLIAIGLTPFLALAVPRRIAPNIEGPGQAFMAGVIGGAIQLVSGVTGPLLDIFYVRTGMTRQVNVATKAAAFAIFLRLFDQALIVDVLHARRFGTGPAFRAAPLERRENGDAVPRQACGNAAAHRACRNHCNGGCHVVLLSSNGRLRRRA